jgi:hypothetical protein
MGERTAKCVRHGLVVCSKCVVVTDAAKRMCYAINNAIAHNGWDTLNNGYMAFRLDDGTTNGTVYDSKRDAIRFTDEQYHAYFCFRQAMGGANPRDCQLFLDVNRHAQEHGGHLRDPDAERAPSIILPTRAHDLLTGRMSLRDYRQ